MSTIRPFVVLLTGLTLVMSGCGWFGKDNLREPYIDAKSGQSLTIPEGVDPPDRRDSMRIPEANAELREVSEAPAASLPIDADDPQSRLKVRALPVETFANVVDALQKAKIGELGERDDKSLRIEVRFEKSEELKRWWWKDGTRITSIRRTAHVLEDEIGSRVVIEDGDSGVRIDDEYAQRVLGALRDRIKWE